MGTTNFDAVQATSVAAALTGQLAAYPTAARTATADPGGTTGVIAAAGMLQFVTVTSDSAAKVITLPAPTPGTIVILRNGATGYELRSSDPATVANCWRTWRGRCGPRR